MTASSRRRRCRPAARAAWLLALCLPAPCALADGSSAADGDAGAAPVEAVDFDPIRVVEKRPQWVDPFAFRPLFDPDANIFQRDWNESPSVEDVSLSGGYVMRGINHGLLKAAETVTRLPGWQHQVQPATARPPPLDEAQVTRAARLREAGARQAPTR